MSGATYRIEIVVDPHSDTYPWDARIYRTSDEMLATIQYGTTYDEAVKAARKWVADDTRPEAQGTTLFLDDNGQDVPADAPHSVKV